MSVLGHVFETLAAMSLLQLLLAFTGCMGYALAQGGLLSSRGRRFAGAAALTAAAGFTMLASDWMAAIMLVAFGVAGIGLFVAAAWVLSRSVLTQSNTTAIDTTFAPSDAGSERDLDPSHPADGGFVPPQPRRRRVQSA